MNEAYRLHLESQLEEIRESGLWKPERVIASPQSPRVRLRGGEEVMVLCANNYLGLADHPEVTAAATHALSQWGYGMASVRFICGTQEIHKQLEERISSFLGTDDTILYSSCFDANGGLFETILGAEDAVISDELNHASIIDGIRLCKARRYRYRNCDMADLEAKLVEASGARHKLIATDGVFSMDGFLAPLRDICALAGKYGALVMVDDSHAVGFIGPSGRGTPEHWGVSDRVDIVTGTLGKALGGASGGYTSGRKQIVDLLRQRSRPYLFSNSLAPPIVAASIRALDLIERDTALLDRIRTNTRIFRQRMTALGLQILPGEHPIIPVMLGDAVLATRMAGALLERGIYVTAFSYPVVPMGKARIRTQVSASHTPEQLTWAAQQFAEVRDGMGA
ncbi:MAG: glycine C-acetyltransferase [Bryobacterales bacterium]|nr:glycine C-acetyltransferase [Bryobacterales bacterium]